MSKGYLNKYENGKSQTLQSRDRANGAMHHSRVREYFDDLESRPTEPAPVVVTVAAPQGKPTAPMGQMMLFDQPVTVKLTDPREVSHTPTAPTPATAATRPAPRTTRWPANLGSQARRSEELTLAGLLRGCGLGLASAAALFLAYLIIT